MPRLSLVSPAASGMNSPTMSELNSSGAQPYRPSGETICKENLGSVAQEHEGAARPYGKTLLTSFTVLKPHTLSGLSDDELQRYIRQVECHSERALAELEKDEDYFGAKGWLDRLDSARAAAYAEAGRRPYVWAAIEAVIDARAAEVCA